MPIWRFCDELPFGLQDAKASMASAELNCSFQAKLCNRENCWPLSVSHYLLEAESRRGLGFTSSSAQRIKRERIQIWYLAGHVTHGEMKTGKVVKATKATLLCPISSIQINFSLSQQWLPASPWCLEWSIAVAKKHWLLGFPEKFFVMKTSCGQSPNTLAAVASTEKDIKQRCQNKRCHIVWQRYSEMSYLSNSETFIAMFGHLSAESQLAHSCGCSCPIFLEVSSERRWGRWSCTKAHMALAAAYRGYP